MNTNAVVRHRVCLGLQPGAGQRLVDVFLEVAQPLLERRQVGGRQHVVHLPDQLGVVAEDVGHEGGQLGVAQALDGGLRVDVLKKRINLHLLVERRDLDLVGGGGEHLADAGASRGRRVTDQSEDSIRIVLTNERLVLPECQPLPGRGPGVRAGQHQPRAAVLGEGSQLGALHLLPDQSEARIKNQPYYILECLPQYLLLDDGTIQKILF